MVSANRKVRDQALPGEQLACLVEREVARRDDEVRRREVGARQPLALVQDEPGELAEPLLELRLVAALHGGRGLLVDLVQPGLEAVRDLELPLAHHAHDHVACPPFCSAPPEGSSPGADPDPSSAFIAASSESTCDCDEIWASCLSRSVWSVVMSSSAPVATSSSTAAARACICAVLSFARWIASPVSAICSPSPVAASPIRTWASAAEYCALMTSFSVRKDSIFAWSCFWLSTSFSCCASSCWIWTSRPWSCCCTPDLRSSACRARSSRPAASACRAWLSSFRTLCSSCAVCIWSRFFAVTTSAMPRLTFWSDSSCFSYE